MLSVFTSAGKTVSVCCIKMREREKGGEREKETDSTLEKNFPVALNSL